jgi:NAD+ kinase
VVGQYSLTLRLSNHTYHTHNLNARPLVIPDETEIKLKVSGREDNYLVSLDSESLQLKQIYTIKKHLFK